MGCAGMLGLQQAIEFFLLCKVQREYRVQTVVHAAEVPQVLGSRSVGLQLSDQAAEETRQSMDFVMRLD